MKNLFKNMDSMKDQLGDLKDQISDIRFRKPWTMGRSRAPIGYFALGAALAVIGAVIYNRRNTVARFCANCGAELKGKLSRSKIKEKAEKIMSNAANSYQGMANPDEHYQPT